MISPAEVEDYTVVTLPDFRADYNEHTQDIGRFTLDYVEGVMDARLSVHGDRLMLAFFGERPRRQRVRSLVIVQALLSSFASEGKASKVGIGNPTCRVPARVGADILRKL